MKVAISNSPFFQILQGIIIGQRKSRMLILLQGVGAEQAGSSLNYNEGLLLHLLESKPNQNVKELAESLKLERSWVSRIVTNLEERKVLNAFVPESDKRSKKLALTKKGKSELIAMSTFRRSIMEERLKELSAKEQNEFAELLTRLSDGLDAPRDVTFGDSHPVDAQLARLSWAVGVVGNDFFGSGFNVTQYQTFFSLVSSEKFEISTSQLYETLPFDLSTISRTIAGFERQRLVEKQTSEKDRRSFSVTLTSVGKTRWKQIESAGVQIIENAMSQFKKNELSRLIQLIEKSNRSVPARIKHDSLEKLELKRATTDESQEIAEGFLRSKIGVEQAKGSSKGRRECYTISIDNKLKAVVELTRSESDGSLSNFLFAAEDLEEKDCVQLIRSCMRVG